MAVRSLLLPLLLAVACGPQQDRHSAEIARAIAFELDSLNGLPTMVVDQYSCEGAAEGCREHDGPTEVGDASALATAFAEARGVPVVRRVDLRLPTCPWHDTETGPPGLLAEFVDPPLIRGDSAWVELATLCQARPGFEQVHRFVLLFDGNGWKVARRTLVSIT